MYRPEHFDEKDQEVITRLMAQFPLATIVAQTKDGLVANHIPVLLEDDDRLIGHIAKANSLHQDLADGAEVLVIVRADDAYISPNYYPTKASDHRHVPTWNYQAVHCQGKIYFDHSVKTKTAIVGKLTKYFERLQFAEKAWRMADAPADYMAGMIDQIVAFRIQIDQVLAKSKLSQNRVAVDYDNVTAKMADIGKTHLFDEMTRKKPKK